jgi:hypothetical protein
MAARALASWVSLMKSSTTGTPRVFALILAKSTLFADFGDFERHRESLAGLNATADLVRRWASLDLSEKSPAQIKAAQWLESAPVEFAPRLATEESRQNVIEELSEKHRLSHVLIRNRKAVVGGFMPRVPVVWEVDMTDQERAAYDAATDYVRTGYARANASRNNALGFLMSVFQKLNSSSSYALRESLRKRIARRLPTGGCCWTRLSWSEVSHLLPTRPNIRRARKRSQRFRSWPPRACPC